MSFPRGAPMPTGFTPAGKAILGAAGAFLAYGLLMYRPATQAPTMEDPFGWQKDPSRVHTAIYDFHSKPQEQGKTYTAPDKSKPSQQPAVKSPETREMVKEALAVERPADQQIIPGQPAQAILPSANVLEGGQVKESGSKTSVPRREDVGQVTTTMEDVKASLGGVAALVEDKATGAVQTMGDKAQAAMQTAEDKAKRAWETAERDIELRREPMQMEDRSRVTLRYPGGQEPTLQEEARTRGRLGETVQRMEGAVERGVQRAEDRLGRVVDKAHGTLASTAESIRGSATGRPSYGSQQDLPSYEAQTDASLQSKGVQPILSRDKEASFMEAMEMLAKDAQRHADYLDREISALADRLPWKKHGGGVRDRPKDETGSLSINEAWQELVNGLDDAKEHAAYIIEQLDALKSGQEPLLAPKHIDRANLPGAAASVRPGQLPNASANISRGGASTEMK